MAEFYQNKEPPKKIHFIWVGGKIPKNYLETIIQLGALAKQSGFELNIWVDQEKNISSALSNLFPQGVESKDRLGFKIRKIDSLIPGMEQDPFYQQNDRLNQFLFNVQRELIGSKNYASVSDLLRYEILRQEGGYYFDTDTHFNFTKTHLHLPKLSSMKLPWGVMTNIELRGNALQKINGDILIAVPNHPVIENAIVASLNNYATFDKKKATFAQNINISKMVLNSVMDVKRYPFGENTSALAMNKRTLGINIAGPGALKEALTEFAKDNKAKLTQFTFHKNKLTGTKQILGLKVKTTFANTWLAKDIYKLSYDTNELSRMSYFQRKEKSKDKEFQPKPVNSSPKKTM